MSLRREQLLLALSVISGRKPWGDLDEDDMNVLGFDYDDWAEPSLMECVMRHCEECIADAIGAAMSEED